MLGPELEPRVSARAAELRVEGQNQNKAESEQGKVLPLGRTERAYCRGGQNACRRGGQSACCRGEVSVPVAGQDS